MACLRVLSAICVVGLEQLKSEFRVSCGELQHLSHRAGHIQLHISRLQQSSAVPQCLATGICIKLMAEKIWHTMMLLKLAFLKSSKVSVSPIDSMRNPSKLVNKPLVHHATDWGLLMPMAAPKQTCAKQAKNVKSNDA